MVTTNNAYYKNICEQLTGETETGTHNDLYYLKKIAEVYDAELPEAIKCRGYYLKHWAIGVITPTPEYTSSHSDTYYLKKIAESLSGETYPWMTANYYLKVINENIGNVKTDTKITWTPPSNLVYGDEFNATGVLTTDETNGTAIEGATMKLICGSTVLGSDTTDENGSATITGIPMSSGTHNFKLEFEGDNDYNGCYSSTAQINVAKETSYMNITSSNTLYNDGTPSITGTLKDNDSPQNPIIGKTVTATCGQSTFTDTTDDNGEFSIDISSLGNGTHSITVTFEDTDYTTSTTSPALSITIANPSLSLFSNKNILSYADADSATLTATLHSANPSGQTVTFEVRKQSDDSLVETLSGTTNSSGIATVSYYAKGDGDLYVQSICAIFVSEEYPIEDNWKYDENEHSANATTDVFPNFSFPNTEHWEVSYDFASSGKECRVELSIDNTRRICMGMGFNWQNYLRVFIEGDEDRSSPQLYSVSNAYASYKYVRDGDNYYFYHNGSLVYSVTNFPLWGTYENLLFNYRYWQSQRTMYVKNVKIKQL